ncbi:pentatricopeptide repeat-containing protein At5g39710-like isoform X1 [Lotus japonicus]|uniref:pentatricopeptide repeat-containing protein At5g39710-like isoform X1 n=1 Tax=Lotus japonicus TaxID=34305 RepID=UPI002588C58C|nr:pentatricopeptide repeat-containing protein At5g39710-like isoform X1 [Lotus japonicus]XP_057449041.1 pentatricopeptide repeat-containing protein At5g39710-like isoform X1 [Lotus japonicus]XP_057449042.1 pentatricopeptide repeat-containing protein At5g39710-like isoform X1 [Lotus japonicus]
MLRGGVLPDKLTYFILMNAYCLEGKFCKAFHMHHEMTHKGFLPDFVSGFSPSLVTYNALIHGLCLLGRVEEALGILRGMAAMGLPPDAVCYTTVISGLCKIGEPRKAYELKLEMDGKNFWWLDLDTYDSLMEDLSDEDIYSNMMNDYFAQGNMKKVYRLDYDMKHDGYLTSDVIFRVYLNALNKKARTIDAKRTLLDMIYKNLWTKPSYFTYDTLIENCSNNEFKSLVGLVKDFSMRGLVGDAGRARDTMLHGNYKPEGSVYNLLIFDHCRSHSVNKAYDMYKEMVHYGFAPHMFSILAVIKALHYDRRYNEMMWVIKNTLKSCNLNDSELRKVLNKINVRECDIDALLDVLAEIAMGGLLLDGGKCSYASAST